MLAAGQHSVLPAQESQEPSPELNQLAAEWSDWYRANAPVSPYAAIRVQRPAGWEPDWSQNALQQRKVEYLQFQGRLRAENAQIANTAEQIDAALLGASMERIHWELEVLASPRRDPGFYLDQSLGSLFELLINSPEPSEADVHELIARMQRFPSLINSAKLTLDKVVRTLSEAAIVRIGDVDPRVDALQSSLQPYVPEDMEAEFTVGIRAVRQSLSSYKDWLTISHQRFDEPVAIGLQRYRWYLGHVELVPRPAEAVIVEAQLAMARLGARLAVLNNRAAGVSSGTSLDNVQRLVQMSSISQRELGSFLAAASLIADAEGVPKFELGRVPPSLQAIAADGELMDLASGEAASRRYLWENRDQAGYLEGLAWSDPRLLVAVDGIPGRAAQANAAASHPRILRRNAISTSLGEGIALYFHEQIVDAGLYSFSPASLQLALQLMHHQAALALTDLSLAQGEWNASESAGFLVEVTGISPALATLEVQRMIAHPGQAGAAFAAYGQAIRYLADGANALQGEFSLPEFNRRMLLNAHVPIALQRWENLGLDDELDQLVEQRGKPATVPE